MTTLSSISTLLKERQRASGMSQEELRACAGLSRQTMTNVLSGEQDYKLSTLIAVADRLGLEVVLMPKSVASGLQVSPQPREVVPSVVDEALRALRQARGAQS